MDSTTPVVLNLNSQEYMKISIDSSDGKRYYADLSSFKNVYCFPKSLDEWKKVYPDSFGTALIWSSRFEVHIDQIIGLAHRIETIQKTG